MTGAEKRLRYSDTSCESTVLIAMGHKPSIKRMGSMNTRKGR